MHPVLTTLEVGGVQFPIGGYGAMLALALSVGAAVALWSAARAGLELGGFIAALGAAIAAGFAGAAGLFALVSWLMTRALPPGPGVVFYGGAIAGALGFAAMARAHELPLGAAFDALLPALPIGHLLGRVGCYLGGCCYGAAWTGPWAVTYVNPLAPAAHPSVPRHPWPLYEAAVLLVLAIAFARRPRGWRAGRASVAYVVVYAIARFALEPLRGDVIRGVGWGAWSTSQVISMALVIGVVIASRVDWREAR